MDGWTDGPTDGPTCATIELLSQLKTKCIKKKVFPKINLFFKNDLDKGVNKQFYITRIDFDKCTATACFTTIFVRLLKGVGLDNF